MMKFNLASPTKKKVLTPKPDPASMLAVECQLASDKWLLKALKTTDVISEELAIQRSSMYENMAHDGRK